MYKTKLLGLILLLTLLTACTSSSVLTNDKQAITTLLDQIETEVNANNFEAFTAFFADDAIIMGEGSPDVIGIENIRKLYFDAMAQADLLVDFKTDEIEIFGDLAYEKGTYILRVSDKQNGTILDESESRYLHIFKKQNNGEWKTWRMFVNNFAPPVKA